MKSGLVTSAVLHTAILTWGLWSISGPKPLDASYAEALPVEIVLSDAFEGVKGEKTAPISEKPAPTPTTRPATLPMTAENTGDNEADLDTPPTPDKTKNVTPQTGAPKPAAQPKPEPKPEAEAPKVAEATPPPKPPEPTPVPVPVKEAAKPTPPQETVPEIDPLAEMIAEDTTEVKPEPQAAPEPVIPNVPVPQVKPRPPTPVKVADAKPAETKTETTKPAKQNKSDSQKDSTADSESDFEAMAAAVINKQKAAGGGAKRSTEQASLGSERTTGTKLSRSQLGEIQGLLNEQMRRCYSVPAGGAEPDALKVSIKIQFDPSGGLVGSPEIIRGGGGSGAERIAAEAAVRAIRRCAPFNLPAEMYAGGWEETTLNFDPSAMY